VPTPRTPLAPAACCTCALTWPHPSPPPLLQSIIKSYREASRLAVEHIRSHAVSLEGKSDEEKKDLLRKCASTSLNSKLVGGGAAALAAAAAFL
jgi:hypothetical protein